MDPNSGIVYLTEDSTPSGFYRYLPNTQGTPHDGGELQMLLVETSDGRSYTTYTDGTGIEYFTSWVTIDSPDYAAGETRPALQGQAKGAAVFRRLEGAWWETTAPTSSRSAAVRPAKARCSSTTQ